MNGQERMHAIEGGLRKAPWILVSLTKVRSTIWAETPIQSSPAAMKVALWAVGAHGAGMEEHA